MTRDDLFTNIHKAIRLGLFELVTTAGSTDWADPGAVARFDTDWRRLVALLDAHSDHEDRHILRILDPHDPKATRAAGAEHRELEGWLAELRTWIESIVADPDPARGLALYRELALFTADYLRHAHDEETTVMHRVWELCTDDEIATTRAAFMADMDPAVLDTSLRLMLPALDPDARSEMISAMAVTAPAPVVDGVLGIAREILDPPEADRLDGLAGRPARSRAGHGESMPASMSASR
jgi:hypothetical protein